MIRLMIAENREALRIGLRMIFSLDANLDVVAEPWTADEALEYARTHAPHIIVLDVDMPNGESLLGELVSQDPHCHVIALTIRPDTAYHQHLRDIGAFACIEKRASPKDLLKAVADATSKKKTLNGFQPAPHPIS
jgi:DNA-binding NarL/FixJ family response regulator